MPPERPPAWGSVDVATERLAACPVCGGTKLRARGTGTDRLHRLTPQRFPYVSCGGCGLVFLVVRPAEPDAPKLYPGNYAPYVAPGPSAGAGGGGRGVAGRAARRLSRAIAHRAPDRLPDVLHEIYRPQGDAVYLDFGFGSVGSLDWAAGRGWKPVGVDFSPIAVGRARDAGHTAYLVGEDWPAALEGSVTLARMNHVFEHLYAPRAVLESLARVVQSGGRLHLAVPNPKSVVWRLFGERWFNADPRHIALYPPELLVRLLREAGFARADVHHEVVVKDAVRSFGYVLEDRRRLSHDGVAALAVAPRPATLLRPLAQLAAKAGRGDRYHVVATR